MKPILKEEYYHKALSRISELTKGDPDKLSYDEFKELETLTEWVYDYEN